MALSGNSIVTEIEKFAGDPYVYGGTSPSGFDCSGLVQYVLTQLGVANVPRTSEQQYAWATKINASQLQPGDLVFAQFPGDNASPGHVGVYVGGGNILSAEDPALGVAYSTLSSWGSNIVGYGQVPGSTAGGGGVTGNTTVTNQGTPSGSGGAAPAAPSASASDLDPAGVLKGAEGLFHGAAVVLDYFFGMFGRGQGWRTVFTLGAIAATFLSYKALSNAGVVPQVRIP
jgi:cell wall-associated NlpC family hydrolase